MDAAIDTADTTSDKPTSDRRGLLKSTGALLATGAAAGLAGCTGGADTPEPGSREALTQTLRAELEGAGVVVRELLWEWNDHNDAYFLQIEAKREQKVILAEMAEVAHGYASFVEQVNKPGENLTAAISPPGADDPMGTFHVMARWAEAYNANEISATEYTDKILETIDER